MKKYAKELIILALQLLMFYVFPLTWGPTDAMGGVIILLLATTALSFIFGGISKYKMKFFYPVVVGIAFLPTVFMFYNSSAIIHAVWYFVASIIGIIIGSILRRCVYRFAKTDKKDNLIFVISIAIIAGIIAVSIFNSYMAWNSLVVDVVTDKTF